MAFIEKAEFTVNRADQKRSDKSPDYYGKFVAKEDIKAGEEMRLAGWVRKSPHGSFISGTISQKHDEPAPQEPQQQPEQQDAPPVPEGGNLPF